MLVRGAPENMQMLLASGTTHPHPLLFRTEGGVVFPKTDAGFFHLKKKLRKLKMRRNADGGGGGAKDSEALAIGAGASSQVQRRAVIVFVVTALATALHKETLKRKTVEVNR